MNRTVFVCACVVAIVSGSVGASSQERSEDFRFESGSVRLAGTLSVPTGTGPFPAVVLLSGSGPQDRDSEAAGFRPFKLIAEHLSSRGIAVLRFDDRGVGGSTGSLLDATTDDLGGDALAAIRALRERADIDGARIGLVGHSEGALVAAVAAARSTEVAFVGWLAGSAVSGADILRMQAAEIPRSKGASPEAIEDILRHHDALIAAVQANASAETLAGLSRTVMASQQAAVSKGPSAAPRDADRQAEALIAQSVTVMQTPWMRYFVSFDPALTLKHVKCPVFAAFGGKDVQVPEAINRARFENALRDGGNRDVTVRLYADANHMFMPAISGQLAEYPTLPKVFVPSLLDDMAAWILR